MQGKNSRDVSRPGIGSLHGGGWPAVAVVACVVWARVPTPSLKHQLSWFQALTSMQISVASTSANMTLLGIWQLSCHFSFGTMVGKKWVQMMKDQGYMWESSRGLPEFLAWIFRAMNFLQNKMEVSRYILLLPNTSCRGKKQI